ncbi:MULTISPECIES: hypothetical protein [Chryseobacterium]|uniref:Uncharacterized protein n=1 Tax=Chryseobacterium taihuense TaxID=1141221 RepID=A0A4U8WNX7_9FLAO|nr:MULTISPECIES: hypothetical protein [Chryseobacterium]QQV02660.1 hypothetical protein I6I61_16600 [Chryseobacterium sp. FDAARGOS 1104]VFB04079.1 Uncharacterised protein [Chryseobacterium taihuense]
MENFKLKNEKLETVIGGFSAPIINFNATGGGETCTSSGACLAYTSDVEFPDGQTMYIGKIIDKPC